MSALPAGRPAAGAWLALVVVLAASLLAWALSPRAVFADDPAKPAPAATPAPEPPGEDLESILLQHPKTLVALVALKWVPALTGLVLIVVWAAQRRGLVRATTGMRAGWARTLLEMASEAPGRPPPTSPFSLGTSAILLGATLMVPSVILLALQSAGAAPTKDLPLAWSLALTGSVSGVVAAAVIVRRRVLHAAGAPPPVAAPVALLKGSEGFCVFALLGILLGLLAKLVLEEVFHIPLKSQDLVHAVVHPARAIDPWLITGFGVLLAPLVEESIHRGMVYAALRRPAGRLVATLASSVLFAGLHVRKLEDLHAFVPLLGLAVLLAVLYERTNSLVAVVGVHALNNATTLVPLLMLAGS